MVVRVQPQERAEKPTRGKIPRGSFKGTWKKALHRDEREWTSYRGNKVVRNNKNQTASSRKYG